MIRVPGTDDSDPVGGSMDVQFVLTKFFGPLGPIRVSGLRDPDLRESFVILHSSQN